MQHPKVILLATWSRESFFYQVCPQPDVVAQPIKARTKGRQKAYGHLRSDAMIGWQTHHTAAAVVAASTL